MAENKQEVAIRSNIGDQVIERVNSLVQVSGFSMPAGYQYVNAIKMALMKLETVKDKNGKGCLEVCTPKSISQSLFKMACQGLDLTKDQCWVSIMGNELVIAPEYFGNAMMLQRIYPSWEPIVRVVREGDIFETSIDPQTGKESVVKHETTLANKDNDFVGAYMYLPSKDGKPNLYVMTKKQIMTAWGQSRNTSLSVHKKFDEKMVIKTMINTGCTPLIKSTPELQVPDITQDSNSNYTTDNVNNATDFHDYEEVVDVVTELPKSTTKAKTTAKAKSEPANVDTSTGEVFSSDPDEIF